MTGEIINAVLQEIKAMPDFVNGGGTGTAMLKTDFKMADIASYGMPFCLLELTEAPAQQLIGGLTQVEWMAAFNSYNNEPDSSGEDPTLYTTDLLNIIDTVRQHFTNGARRTFIYAGTPLTPGALYTVSGPANATITYNGNSYAQGSYFTAVTGITAFTAANGGCLLVFAWLTPGMTQVMNDYAFRFTLSGIMAADALEGDGLVMGYKIVFESVSFDTSTGNITPSTAVVTTVNQVNNPPFD